MHDLALVLQLLVARHLVLRDAEVHPDRIERRDVGEVRAVRERVHVRALALQRAAGDTGERRGDGGVAQVEVRLVDLRLRREDGRLGGVELALGAVEVGLRQRVLLGQRLHAAIGHFRGGKPRLLRLQLAARRVELRLERLRVELEHELALLDELAFPVRDAVEETRHARDDVDLARAFGLRHEHRRVRESTAVSTVMTLTSGAGRGGGGASLPQAREQHCRECERGTTPRDGDFDEHDDASRYCGPVKEARGRFRTRAVQSDRACRPR